MKSIWLYCAYFFHVSLIITMQRKPCFVSLYWWRWLSHAIRANDWFTLVLIYVQVKTTSNAMDSKSWDTLWAVAPGRKQSNSRRFFIVNIILYTTNSSKNWANWQKRVKTTWMKKDKLSWRGNEQVIPLRWSRKGQINQKANTNSTLNLKKNQSIRERSNNEEAKENKLHVIKQTKRTCAGKQTNQRNWWSFPMQH